MLNECISSHVEINNGKDNIISNTNMTAEMTLLQLKNGFTSSKSTIPMMNSNNQPTDLTTRKDSTSASAITSTSTNTFSSQQCIENARGYAANARMTTTTAPTHNPQTFATSNVLNSLRQSNSTTSFQANTDLEQNLQTAGIVGNNVKSQSGSGLLQSRMNMINFQQPLMPMGQHSNIESNSQANVNLQDNRGNNTDFNYQPHSGGDFHGNNNCLQINSMSSGLSLLQRNQSFQREIDQQGGRRDNLNPLAPKEMTNKPQVSIQRKRKKPPNSSTAGCTCKKSKCLKLYCQCFASSVLCDVDKCVCISCENKIGKEEEIAAAKNVILERNPRAFEDKFRSESTSGGNRDSVMMAQNRGAGVHNFPKQMMGPGYHLSSNNGPWGRYPPKSQSNNQFGNGPFPPDPRFVPAFNITHASSHRQQMGNDELRKKNTTLPANLQYHAGSYSGNQNPGNQGISRVVSGSPISNEKSVMSHKAGCKCRKSFCLKKYCECYHHDVKCGSNCKCINCKNQPDDRRDGHQKTSSELIYLAPSNHELGVRSHMDSSSSNKPAFYRQGISSFPTQFPTQEYRGGAKKAHDTDIKINSDKFMNSTGTDRMEIMAALAMTELGGNRSSISLTPSTPERKVAPRPVSSTPETALGTKSFSKGNLQSAISANKGTTVNNQKRSLSLENRDNWHQMKKARVSPTYDNSFPSQHLRIAANQMSNLTNNSSIKQVQKSQVSYSQDKTNLDANRSGPMRKRVVNPTVKNTVDLRTFRQIGKLPPPLSYRKICSKCGKPRSEHGELGFGNKCVYQECGRCGAGIQVHQRAGKLMGFLCTLTVEEGAIPGKAKRYDKTICDLAMMAELKKEVSSKRKVGKNKP